MEKVYWATVRKPIALVAVLSHGKDIATTNNRKPKTHLWTIDDLREHGHYMTKLALAEKPEIVTVRKVENDEETSSFGGKEVRVIRPAGTISMVKLPNGTYIEIYPEELEALEKIHTVVWEEEKS